LKSLPIHSVHTITFSFLYPYMRAVSILLYHFVLEVEPLSNHFCHVLILIYNLSVD